MKSALLSILAAGLLASQLSAFAQTKSQSAAVQLASNFCKKIGAPVTATPIVEFPYNDGGPAGRRQHFWLPRWHIDFPGEAWVEVVDKTGVICRYSDSAHSKRRDLDHAAPGPALSDSEVIARATKILAATGQTEELGPPEVHESDMCYQTSAFSHQQTVLWKRMYQGIPYADDSAAVTIQPETGEILQVGIDASFAPPKIPNFKALLVLDQDRAVKAARAHLICLGARDLQLLTGKLQLSKQPELVQPNSFWVDGHSRRLALPLRPAWLTTFKVGERNGYCLWIDAQNGRVIAGEDVSPLSGPLPFKLTATKSSTRPSNPVKKK